MTRLRPPEVQDSRRIRAWKKLTGVELSETRVIPKPWRRRQAQRLQPLHANQQRDKDLSLEQLHPASPALVRGFPLQMALSELIRNKFLPFQPDLSYRIFRRVLLLRMTLPLAASMPILRCSKTFLAQSARLAVINPWTPQSEKSTTVRHTGLTIKPRRPVHVIALSRFQVARRRNEVNRKTLENLQLWHEATKLRLKKLKRVTHIASITLDSCLVQVVTTKTRD